MGRVFSISYRNRGSCSPQYRAYPRKDHMEGTIQISGNVIRTSLSKKKRWVHE